jgi:hypothetical protein
VNKLPPTPTVVAKRRLYWTIGLIVAAIVVLNLAAIGAYYAVLGSGITAGPDEMFGDQNLKTAVALIELYKVRYGKYPDSLRDLKFTGQWDQLAINSVRYTSNADRTKYYVEVERGWIGKPKLNMPDEFWQGTGYDPSLRSKE